MARLGCVMRFLCAHGHVVTWPSGYDRVVGDLCECGQPLAQVPDSVQEGVGYHYTTADALPSIREHGLQPYPLNENIEGEEHTLLKSVLDPDAQGVYVWPVLRYGHGHAGRMLSRAIIHKTWRMALLRVDFPLDDVVWLERPDGRSDFILAHALGLRDWVMHLDEAVMILGRPQPPDRIRLVRTFDISRAVEFSGNTGDRLAEPRIPAQEPAGCERSSPAETLGRATGVA